MSQDATLNEPENNWTEEVSQSFLQIGNIIVPQRGHQMEVICALLANLRPDASILEVCCGEGLLAEAILKAYPGFHLRAIDGSQEMLQRAGQRLNGFADRIALSEFNLASRSWRDAQAGFDGVVSSLAIHHLPGAAKLELFRDIYAMLAPGGMLVVADVVEVVGAAAKRQAADEWDQAVRRQSLEQTSKLDTFEFFIREGWNMHRYLDPEDIDMPSPLVDQLGWLDEAGFIEINVCWMTAGHAIFCARKAVED